MLAGAAPFAPFSATLTSHRHRHANIIIPTRNNVSVAPLTGTAALSAIKSSSDSGSHPSSRENKKKNPPSSAPLSGSDVLLALQRAAAEKAKRAAIRKGKKRKQGGGIAPAPAPAAEEVRPLKIRSDWGARLDELERLLQELKMEDESR